MQDKSIQHQHFWIELILGAAMLYNVIVNSLEKGIVATIVLGMAIVTSQNICKGRIAALRRAEKRKAWEAEQARKEEARRRKEEAFRLAQLEASRKYLE